MYVCALELFRIGPGPSSSRTLGAQRAALRFVHGLAADGLAHRTARVEAHLFGSLALAGRESGSDAALIAGLAGDAPEHSDARSLRQRSEEVAALGLPWPGNARMPFQPARDLRFHMGKALAFDGNAVRFDAFDAAGKPLATQVYFTGNSSGDVLDAHEAQEGRATVPVPYAVRSPESLLATCRRDNKRLADLARANEYRAVSPEELRRGLADVDSAMRACVERGLATRGTLPGGAPRRAPDLAAGRLAGAPAAERCAVLARAVAEENAAGGRVVAAPTHGAAGPVAALLAHWRHDAPLRGDERAADFLLTAAIVGQSIHASGLRQAGCQSAIGVAAAMAAAGYVAAQGGSAAQALFAAERALEAHWGLACDEVGARVQDPCIERNATGARRAIDAAHAALRLQDPRIALDGLVRAMAETGRGMAARYRDDAITGLARNVAGC